MTLTVEQEALKGFLHIQLRVQRNQPEADRKGIIRSAPLEKPAYFMQSGIMCFLGLVWR